MSESFADEAWDRMHCCPRSTVAVCFQCRQCRTVHHWWVLSVSPFILAQPSHKGCTLQLIS